MSDATNHNERNFHAVTDNNWSDISRWRESCGAQRQWEDQFNAIEQEKKGVA